MKRDLQALEALSRTELASVWESTFGRSLPASCGQPLIRQLLAWRWQADQYGDLTRAEQQQLAGTGSPALTPGSRLVRVWKGHTYQVEVLPDGFLCQGQRYTSLSAIATAITGTRWSGPVFFGVKPTRS
jgi:hypothetical protein